MFCKKLFFYNLIFFSLYAQEDLKYQVPPKAILDLIDVTMPPRVLVDDNKYSNGKTVLEFSHDNVKITSNEKFLYEQCKEIPSSKN